MCNFRGFCAERRLDSQLVKRLYQNADIMCQHLTENLIDLSHGALGFHGSAKLGLDHRHGGLGVRPLVIVSVEIVAVEIVQVPCASPEPIERLLTRRSSRALLKGNVGGSADLLDGVEALAAGVRFVGGYFVDRELARRLRYQTRELRVIRRLCGRRLHRRYDVGLDSDHEVRLDPSLARSFLAPFVVEPAGIGRCGKASRVGSEIVFDHAQRGGGLLYQRGQERSQFGVGKVVGNGIEVGRVVDKAVTLRPLYVTGEPAAREARVHFENAGEQHVGKRQSRATRGLRWLRNGAAKVSQKNEESFLFILLRQIVARPLLRVGGGCGRIKGNHSGAKPSVLVRERRCQQHWRSCFIATIVVDFREKVKLKRVCSHPLSTGL